MPTCEQTSGEREREKVAFLEPLSLKNRILDFMWQHLQQLYLEAHCAPTKNIVTAKTQLGYSDNNCRGEVPSAKL